VGDRRTTDLADAVRRAVAAHDPADGREAEARERILTALATLADPFDLNADPTHVTGSAIVVGRRGTVLHMHKRLHRWMQPGGHLDPGEAPWEAALRESEEETGLALRHPTGGPRLVHVDVHPAAEGHTHLDLRYLLLAPDDDPSPPEGESPLARWYSWDEALALADDGLRGALEVVRADPAATEGS
jgi:8-oxo-dGTP pyrophosphatase MutT (NUDIX family)